MSGRRARWAGAAAVLAGLAIAAGGTILQAEDVGHIPLHRVLRQIDLSEQQRAQIEEVLKAEREGMREHREAVAQRHRALQEAVRSGAEEWALREKATELGVAAGDLAVKEAAIHAQIQGILTAEQKQKLGELRTKMQERREHMREHMMEWREGFGGEGPFPDFLEP